MSNYRQLFKSTGLLGSVQALYILISVVRNKVAAQLIGAVGMGLADLYARSLDLLGGATNFGLGMSGVKRLSALAAEEHADRAKLDEEVKLLRTWVVVTALLGAAVCLVFSPLISLFACDTTARTGAFCQLAPAVAMTTLAGGEIAILLIGCIVSFLVSLMVIRGLMSYVRQHSFSVFGVYRIVLGILVLAYFAFVK